MADLIADPMVGVTGVCRLVRGAPAGANVRATAPRLGGMVMLSLSLVLCVAACAPELTVEQQVIAVIRDMESRVEQGERRPFMNQVADEFSGQDGQMNRDQLNAFVLYNMRRYERLQVQLLPIQVTPAGVGAARATFRALVTGGPGWLPDSAQVFEVRTNWVVRDGQWLLTQADWNPLRLEGVLDYSR